MSTIPTYFKLHPEKKIGLKRLTDADLGRAKTSHQTHIGLKESVLSFLLGSRQDYETDEAVLVYENKVQPTKLHLHWLPSQSVPGEFRSPSITSKMDDGNPTVCESIRTIARTDGPLDNWYLLWFALDTEFVVFYLLQEGSSDYNEIEDLLPKNRNNTVISDANRNFSKICRILEAKVLKVDGSSLIEAERDILSNTFKYNRKKVLGTRLEDLQKLVSTIGVHGENLVNAYLEREKKKNNVTDFLWMNKNGESGKPFDFEIHYSNGLHVFADAKTTMGLFDENPVYFSLNEVNFASSQVKNYAVFRVYNLAEENQEKLRIGRDPNNTLFSAITRETNSFGNAINNLSVTLADNFSFKVDLKGKHLLFDPEITLN